MRGSAPPSRVQGWDRLSQEVRVDAIFWRCLFWEVKGVRGAIWMLIHFWCFSHFSHDYGGVFLLQHFVWNRFKSRSLRLFAWISKSFFAIEEKLQKDRVGKRVNPWLRRNIYLLFLVAVPKLIFSCIKKALLTIRWERDKTSFRSHALSHCWMRFCSGDDLLCLPIATNCIASKKCDPRFDIQNFSFCSTS